MKWEKIKLFLILCLVLVDVLLGVACVRLIRDRSLIPEDEIAFASAHLTENGLSVTRDSFDRAKRNPAIYEVKAAGDEEKAGLLRSFARALFGIESDVVKTPQGFGISVSDAEGAVIGTGSLEGNLQIECCFDFAAETLSSVREKAEHGETSESPDKTDKKEKRAADAFVKKLAKLIEDADFSFTAVRSAEEGEFTAVFYEAVFDRIAAPELSVIVVTKNEKVVGFAGSIPFSAPQKAYTCRSIDSVNILYRFSEDKKGTVDGIRPAYLLAEKEDGSSYLVPAWTLSFTDENREKHVFIRDAVTGDTEKELFR